MATSKFILVVLNNGQVFMQNITVTVMLTFDLLDMFESPERVLLNNCELDPLINEIQSF